MHGIEVNYPFCGPNEMTSYMELLLKSVWFLCIFFCFVTNKKKQPNLKVIFLILLLLLLRTEYTRDKAVISRCIICFVFFTVRYLFCYQPLFIFLNCP